jgi:hypothetical protein
MFMTPKKELICSFCQRFLGWVLVVPFTFKIQNICIPYAALVTETVDGVGPWLAGVLGAHPIAFRMLHGCTLIPGGRTREPETRPNFSRHVCV